MARVLAHVPDLLFGSKVRGMLAAGGHDVALAGSEAAVRERIGACDVLVVDLTADDAAGIALLEALTADELVGGARTLAFYSHVDAGVRTRAIAAGFDLVVPRSRMAREGAALVDRLAG
jgi:DNA-binding NarL/FixJ family response regulator